MFPKPTKQEKTRKPLKRSPMKPGRKPLLPRSKNPRRTAHERAWKAFSLWVRLTYADPNGFVRCFTCNIPRHYKEMDAGHFIHGDNMDFIVENIHPQCDVCNRHMSGNMIEYTLRMLSLYGQETVDDLRRRRHDVVKRGIADFLAIEADYKERIKNL